MIIPQEDSKYTVQLTGKDLEDYIADRKKSFAEDRENLELTEEQKEIKKSLDDKFISVLSNQDVASVSLEPEEEEEEEKKYQIAELDEQFDSYDEAVEFCYEEDIIYYNRAIKYLSENDSSLRESLELANDLGCTLENLSSETLATIHYQNYLIGEIEEI